MKKGVFVEFKPDGTEVQINGNGIDVLKAMEVVLNALDESLGSTILGDDILERLSEKRKQSREKPSDEQCIVKDAIEKIKSEKPSGLIGLLLMMEALNAMKSGERESFASFNDQLIREFESRTGHSVKERSNIKDHASASDKSFAEILKELKEFEMSRADKWKNSLVRDNQSE